MLAWSLQGVLTVALLGFSYVLTPLLVIWSWIVFIRRSHLRDKRSWFSLAALVLTTSSGLLAIGTLFYARVAGGFAYYDPSLLRIFKIGLLLSLAALIGGLIGVAFRSPLRWQAAVAAFGMVIFWFLSASAE
jgi:hypothetical protein